MEKKTLEGKVIFVDAKDASAVIRRLEREVDVVAPGYASVIQKLKETPPDGVFAVVLTFFPEDARAADGCPAELQRIIAAAHELGYSDGQLMVYSSFSLFQALRDTFIRPYRQDAVIKDRPYLIRYLNRPD